MTRRPLRAVALALAFAATTAGLPPNAVAKPRKRGKRRAGARKKAARKKAARKKAARGEPVEVPIDVGVGPAALLFSGLVGANDRVLWGLKLNVHTIVDQALIRAHQDRIPPKYRRLAARVTEARISPSIFIPDTLLLSPPLPDIGMLGATWRPVSLSIPLFRRPMRLDISPGLILTYAYLWVVPRKLANCEPGDPGCTALPVSSMHFLRPGLDLKAELEIPMTDTLLLSIGWTSQVHVPQVIGGSFTAVRPLDDAIWHVGQAFLKLHVRFPYRLR